MEAKKGKYVKPRRLISAKRAFLQFVESAFPQFAEPACICILLRDIDPSVRLLRVHAASLDRESTMKGLS